MIWPGLAIGSVVVVAAVPWGLPDQTTFILPFMTLLLVFLFSIRRRLRIPVWLVFLSGLATDVLTAGPVGYWALLYTMTYTLGRLLFARLSPGSIAGLWLAYAVTAGVVALVGWGVASIYYLRIIDWWPITLGLLCSAALCPLAAWVMRGPLSMGRGNDFSFRGLRG